MPKTTPIFLLAQNATNPGVTASVWYGRQPRPEGSPPLSRHARSQPVRGIYAVLYVYFQWLTNEFRPQL